MIAGLAGGYYIFKITSSKDNEQNPQTSSLLDEEKSYLNNKSKKQNKEEYEDEDAYSD